VGGTPEAEPSRLGDRSEGSSAFACQPDFAGQDPLQGSLPRGLTRLAASSSPPGVPDMSGNMMMMPTMPGMMMMMPSPMSGMMMPGGGMMGMMAGANGQANGYRGGSWQ